MKKPKLKTRFIVIIVVISVIGMLSACGNGEKNNQGEEQGSAKETEPQHSHSADDHSALMNDTREWLKKELGEKYNDPVPPATPAQMEQGKEIFTKYCASCHGTTGKGDGPSGTQLNPKPADFTDPVHSTFYSDEGRIYIIKKGIKGTGMAAWENTLNEEEIYSVYTYIQSLKNPKENIEHHHNH